MSNLTKYERFDKDGIEILINLETGESFASVSGYARMANKPQSTISSRVNDKKVPNGNLEVQKVEIQTQQGLRSVRIITEDQICEWLPKDNPSTATQLLKLGVRVFMHKLAGYEVKSTAIELTRLQILEMALESERELEKTKEEKKLLQAHNDVLTETCYSLKEEIVEKEPLVQLAETLVTHDKDTVKIHEFAQAMNMSRNDMYDLLRDINFIQQKPSRLPYQKHLDAKRVEVYRKPRSHQPGQYDTVPVLTAKGQKYVCKKIKELQNMKQIEVKMEAFLTADDF